MCHCSHSVLPFILTLYNSVLYCIITIYIQIIFYNNYYNNNNLIEILLKQTDN